MLLLWMVGFQEPVGVIHFEPPPGLTAAERRRAEEEFLLLVLAEEDTLTMEDTWQFTDRRASN